MLIATMILDTERLFPGKKHAGEWSGRRKGTDRKTRHEQQ